MSATPSALRHTAHVAIVPLARRRPVGSEAVDPRLEPFLQAMADMVWRDIHRELEQENAQEKTNAENK